MLCAGAEIAPAHNVFPVGQYFSRRTASSMPKPSRSTGRTVYVITHDPELICQCCTDIHHLESGNIVACYPMDAAGVSRIRDFFRIS